MKKIAIFLSIILTLSSCSDMLDAGIDNPEQKPSISQDSKSNSPLTKLTTTESESDVWVGAYLASYSHYVEPTGNWGNLPTEEIDWDAFTHLFYFSLKAQADGSLSTIAPYQNMSPDRINSVISAAHQNGKPVLFTVGGWGNYDGFSNAIKPANRALFITNIISTLTTWGFDGVDLDMEPINSGDVDNYIAFINELHTALQSVDVQAVSRPLLTVVTNWHADLFAQIHDKVDQINLMTYDFSGAWEGWVTWHNAAVYSGGLTFPSVNKPLPSIDEKVKTFIQAGVPASKLGIGIDFYGYVWSGGSGTSTGGATEPNQSWSTPPVVTDNVAYHEIMDRYYDPSIYRWDDQAQAAYLRIDQSGSSNDMFISYDDEQSIRSKFDYARQKGLGGTIIWELAGGYRENQPSGERDNLLQAVKEALNNGSAPAPDSPPADDVTAPSVTITAPADGTTVSGTVQIDIDAIDDTGVSNVELLLNGISVQNYTSAPYSYSWNTTNHENHVCVIEVRAEDGSGNSSFASLDVTVNNTQEDETPSSPPATGGIAVYEESLNSPWINVSWNASVNYSSTGRVLSGNKAIKVAQNPWGALSMRSGNWGQGQDVNSADHEAVEFSIYPENQQAEISVMLENDAGQSFPRVSVGAQSANQWSTVRVPLSELNPGNQAIHRIDIMETSGASRTYYLDDVRLAGSGTSTGSSDSPDSPDSSEEEAPVDVQEPASYDLVYGDLLESPWINASWNANVDFGNTEFSSTSIKVAQNSWGALSLHSGNWGQGVPVQSADYETVEFSIYPKSQQAEISVMLENDAGQSFTRVSIGSQQADQWSTVQVPLSELNPGNHTIHRIDIMETSGASRTYHIKDLRFVSK